MNKRIFFGMALLTLTFPQMVLCQKDKSPGEGETVSYFKDIRPLFQQNCQGCHQPAKKQGGYLMVDYPSLFQKGDREIKSVVPGKPESSLLFGLITPKGNEKPEMPKGKDPLSKTQVELVRKWILQGAKDDSPKSVQKTVDPDHPPVYFLPPVITSLDYSPDGKTLAVSGYHEVLLHPSDGNGPPTRLIGLSERIESLAFSPDGKKLAVAGGSPGRFGEIQVWDLEKKKLALSAPTTHDTVYGVSWSPDGGKIAFGCADNTLRAIDSTTGQQLLFQGAHTDWVLGTTFSRDGLFLASISRDRSMKLTEVATQRFIDNITSITPGALKGGLHVVALKPSKEKTMTKGAEGTDSAEKIYEEILIGGSDGVPRVYKMHRVTKRVIGDDANKVREYEGIPGRICSGAFDKTGKLFAIGGSLDGKGYLRLYQTEDAKVLLRQDAGLGPIYTLAFHPQGNFLALGGFDGRVQILQIPSGQKVREFVPVPLSAGKN